MTALPAPHSLGLIGGGRWGRIYMKTLQNHPRAHLAHLVSSNDENRAFITEGCPISNHWQEMLENKIIEGVIIATPPQSHFDIASAFIKSGIPVLIEKPLTMNLDEAFELLKLARAHKTTVMVDHIHVYSPAFQTLMSRAQNFGPVRRIEAEAGNAGPLRKNISVLWDWAPHDIAMCYHLVPDMPELSSARILESTSNNNGIGQSIRIGFKNKSLEIDLRFSNIRQDKARVFKVHFDNHSLVYDDLKQDKLIELPSHRTITVPAQKPLDRVIDLFTNAILDHDISLESLKLGVKVCDMLTACDALLNREPN